MKIGRINTDQNVAVVAEIGNNHEGDIAVACELVHAAAEAGAHAVKFQAIEPRFLVSETERERILQLERFQLSPEQFHELHDLANKLGIGFLCTPFYLGAISWLTPLVDAFKIASADNNIPDLLEVTAQSKKPILISTGMSDTKTLIAAKNILASAGAAEIMFLHCVSAYPTEHSQASLASIPFLARTLKTAIGYSDHTLGVEACVIATALGARLIEKHFTLDHTFSSFRDHQLSAEPDELAQLIARIDEVQAMIGTPRNGLFAGEEQVAESARRSLVAVEHFPQGHVLREHDLTWLRPAGGIPPSEIESLLSRSLNKSIKKGERVKYEDLNPGTIVRPGKS